jgi:hypothetical protein
VVGVDVVGVDVVGLDVVGLDVVGLDVVGLDVVGLDVVGVDVVGVEEPDDMTRVMSAFVNMYVPGRGSDSITSPGGAVEAWAV